MDVAFPRMSDKLAMMACENVMALEITYQAARKKNSGRRCDIEAGMGNKLFVILSGLNISEVTKIIIADDLHPGAIFTN